MNSEERDVIGGIFQRLEQASSQPRDAEAERFIADAESGFPFMNEQRGKMRGHTIETVGKELRDQMPFINKKALEV